MRVVTTLFFLFISLAVAAQTSRAELEKQRQQIIASIKETQDQLAATKKDQKATLSQFRALQAKLNARQRLIQNINQEIGSIDNTIQSSAGEVAKLQRTLEQQQAGYARSIRYAYSNRNSYNTLVFIFSSQDYNEALRRMKYLKKYREFRKAQVEQIRHTQDRLQGKIGELNTQRSQKNMLLTTEETQRVELQKETNETDAVVKELKGREKELAREIEKNTKAARQVDQQISRIIQREIELAQKKAEEEARKKREEEQRKAAALAAAQQPKPAPPAEGGVAYGNVKLNTGSGAGTATGGKTTPAPKATTGAAGTPAPAKSTPPNAGPVATLPPRPKAEPPSYKLTLTPEAAALSNSFEANKGKLPWPVEKGFISLGFGPYKHPTEARIMLDNAGISINTSLNAPVRAVFAGTVSSAFFVSGAGWTVVISHGQYYTVYSGLANTSVQKDQAVTIKQPLGVVAENEEGVPVINFQVWKVGNNNKTFKIDPAGWIAR